MFGIGLGNLVKIGFRVSDHILKQQEIERSRTASERARLEAQASSTAMCIMGISVYRAQLPLTTFKCMGRVPI